MSGATVLVIDDSPTILKVVQLVLTKAGFDVLTATDGEAGVAAARARRPDLILLDFVMPRMNGYQVCRALAADASLHDVPVVLMSAKGDELGERFVKVMGIVDYITKPFSPEAITAVAQHTIAKYADAPPPGRAIAPGGDPEGRRDAELLDDDSELVARRTVLAEVRGAIAEVVAPPVAALVALAGAANDPANRDDADSQVPLDAGAIADAASKALDDDALAAILARVRPGLFEGGDAGPVLQGDLRVVPIAEVLQLLQAQGQTGVLSVERSCARIDASFRQGRIELASAHGMGDDFLVGRYVVGLQLMSKQDLEGLIAANPPGSRLIGQHLVQLGYLGEHDLKQSITKQTCELVYEILRWNFGRFAFRATRDLPPTALDAALGLDVEGILMEGVRRIDEWHLIEREIESFDLVFLRNEDAVAQVGRGRLTREELAVLELVNGKNTVKDIIRQSRMGSFEVSKMLYRLLSIKLVRRRVMPVAV